MDSAGADSFLVSDHHFSEDELQNDVPDLQDMDEDAGTPVPLHNIALDGP